MYEKETELWAEAGKQWLEKGLQAIDIGGRLYEFTSKQAEAINNKARYLLLEGGFGSGKTLILILKMILFCLFFPKNRVLLGRAELKLIEEVLLPDFWDIVPKGWCKWNKTAGTIDWFNGSQILLFALKDLVQGDMADIKEARQKLKSLNLGAAFIDQLEEVSEAVWETIASRLRRAVPIHQICATVNPVNHWSYDYFKENPRPNTHLIEEMTMFDTLRILEKMDMRIEENDLVYKAFKKFVDDQLTKDPIYVKRFVHGLWHPSVMVKGCVFDSEHFRTLRGFERKAIRESQGIEIYVEPDKRHEYQIGDDPSEGANDPSHIACVDKFTGEKVAGFSKLCPPEENAEKLMQMANIYTTYTRPKIILEMQGGGVAVLQVIKSYPKIYRRQVFDYKEKRTLEKLGWRTNAGNKSSLITNFRRLLDTKQAKVYDKATIDEMQHFIWSDEAKFKGAGAQTNFHDDRVMATMLAYWEINPAKKDANQDMIKKELLKGLLLKHKQKTVI